jgi:hypothetical protein
MLVREIDAHRVVSRVIPILVEWAVFSASPPTLGSMGLVPGGGGMVLGAQICLPLSLVRLHSQLAKVTIPLWVAGFQWPALCFA